MPQYSANECAQAVKWYVERNSVATAQRIFLNAFHKHPPSRPTVLTWADSFASREDFEKKNPVSKRESLLKNEELMEAVPAVFESDPQLSTRRAARLFGISEKSVRRILRKNCLRPYRMQVVQALHDGDNVRRLEFCKIDDGMRERAFLAHEDRLRLCVSVNDGHIESAEPWSFKEPLQHQHYFKSP
ncbi:hypothetical protein HPB47_005249 [Ixodes persulcatus]|uniref:Uncharacterized protein n=1 Tax=Ixodes persulcatus TaxID=34615 RepID=A0AC60PEV4_IXOPE|nr:hypothetical protein HPB47_005249 [Ixodes persulcatus]